MKVVRTVLGDVAPAELGMCYMHEHLIIDSTLVADRLPHIHLPSADDAIAELGDCADAGVGAMVDAMPCASGRKVLALAHISRSTGVHVVAATGLHTARYYEGAPWTREEAAAVLGELFRADIETGIDRYDYTGPVVRRTSHRAGIIKCATLGRRPDAAERRVFEAAARAHLATGAPVLTHCEDGLGADAQLELLSELGLSPGRIVLSHTDKRPDLGYHRELLSAGVNLEYDQALRQAADTSAGSARLLREMLSEGYSAQLMLGTDGARRSLWRTLEGGPGLAWLATDFPQVLTGYGIDDATWRTLMVDNPARLLSFEP